MIRPCRKRVIIQFDLEGNQLNVFLGVGEASKITGIDRNVIQRSAFKGRASHGFIWRYA